MKLTNNYNLPEAIVKAIGDPRKPNPDYFHVTEFIAPPLIRHLKLQYWDQLTEDVSERLWSLLGQSVHTMLEKVNLPGALHEEELFASFSWSDRRTPYLILGRPDLYQDQEITDWKITSVYSFLIGDKPEWERQLNLYKWLYNEALELPVESLKIHAILRDFMISKSLQSSDYPDIPFQTVNITIYSNDELYDYMSKQAYRHSLDMLDNAAICTPDERWRRPTTYAIMKEGGKKAKKVFTTKEDAEHYLSDTPKNIYIETRQGKDIRCENYCPVRNVCPVKFTKEDLI